ncbi:MAG: tetratricopeptide repeat protein [Deltaproteobacteria bacterium]|nr:tetratricopeptide repeat protein [Deltaproteobacteria bacterium]
MLRQKTLFSLLVISFIGLYVFPISKCDAVTGTSFTGLREFPKGNDTRGEGPQIAIALSQNDISKPDSKSLEKDMDSSGVLTERQRDTLKYANTGFKYFKKGQFEKAISNFDKAIELDPGVTLCYLARGQIYMEKREIDKAISDFNRTIELNPYLMNAYIFRGGAYFIAGQIDNAIVDYNKAIEMKPEDAAIYNLRGNAYYTKGDIDKAIADYSRAIEINPGLAAAYYNRGSAYNFYGRIDLASDDYQKALELNPGYGKTNDDREIVCRRNRAVTGSILPREYCATKSQWASEKGIGHEKIPGVTTYTREYPGDSLLPID